MQLTSAWNCGQPHLIIEMTQEIDKNLLVPGLERHKFNYNKRLVDMTRSES
jgi:hypothetical protein